VLDLVTYLCQATQNLHCQFTEAYLKALKYIVLNVRNHLIELFWMQVFQFVQNYIFFSVLQSLFENLRSHASNSALTLPLVTYRKYGHKLLVLTALVTSILLEMFCDNL
jgi:hypothetical protein